MAQLALVSAAALPYDGPAFAGNSGDVTVDQPHIAQTSPIVVTIKAGVVYWWCACGRSKTQPFCDGSHKGTVFSPIKVEPAADERVFFCACKHSAKKPYCDGTHKTLRNTPA